MMKRSRNLCLCVPVVLASVLSPLEALEVDDARLVRAAGLMHDQQWQQAYAAFEEIDKSEQAKGVSAGVYGKLLFSMGLCQMELARAAKPEVQKDFYLHALSDFKRCREFQGSPLDPNPFIRRSLLRIGMCRQALGEFDEAYRVYNAFLLEHNQLTDAYDRGSLLVNLASCAVRMSEPDVAKAIQYLDEAVKGRQRNGTSAFMLLDAVLTVRDHAVSQMQVEQRAQCAHWVETLAAVALAEEPQNTTERLCESAELALLAQDSERALQVLQQLPWIPNFSTLDKAMSASLVVRSLEAYAQVVELEKKTAVYQFLLKTYPAEAKVEEWMYQRILFDLEMGELAKASEYIARLRKKFPTGARLEDVQLLEMSTLFDSQAYAEALALANAYLEKKDLKPAAREASLYVASGARCFLRDYTGCVEAVDAFFEEFPESNYMAQLTYYKAVSYARLGLLQQARDLFDDVVEIGSDPQLGLLAKFELVLLDFDVARYAQASESIDALLDGGVEGTLRVQVDLLSARVSAILRDRKKAEQRYLSALELVRELGDMSLEQEVLFYIVSFYGREMIAEEPNPQMQMAIPYYDAFFEKFEDSEYAAQVAAAAMPALESAGQQARGIERLDNVLKHACERQSFAGVREAARVYTWAQIASGVKLKDLRKEASSAEPSAYAVARLFAVLEVYQAGYKQAYLSWGKKLRYDAILRELYSELVDKSKGIDVASYVRIELGEWFLKDGNFPELAIEQFAKAQDAEFFAHRLLAEFGLAKSYRLLGGDENLRKSHVLLESVVARSEAEIELLEEAMAEQMEVAAAMQKWSYLTDLGKEYLVAREFSEYRSRVWFLLAKSYDERGLVEDAIANYSRIFVSFTRVLEVSAPSVERLSDLTWERNVPENAESQSDKQVAYELAHRYLTMIKDYPQWEKEREGVAESLQQIRKNVATWEASGEVISVEQMLKEMRMGKR